MFLLIKKVGYGFFLSFDTFCYLSWNFLHDSFELLQIWKQPLLAIGINTKWIIITLNIVLYNSILDWFIKFQTQNNVEGSLFQHKIIAFPSNFATNHSYFGWNSLKSEARSKDTNKDELRALYTLSFYC